MDIGIISMRYAKALLQYAKDTSTEERFYEEMRMLEHNFREQPRLREALSNPVLGKREKLSLLATASMGEQAMSREFARFMTLVLKNGREGVLQYICLTFLYLYRKEHNIVIGKLITATPVSDEVKQRIRREASTRLQAHTELRTEVDPEIEGGFIFDINGVRLDASIATQLKSVRRQFVEKNRRIV